MQSMIGAAGHLAAEMLVSADEEVARIKYIGQLVVSSPGLGQVLNLQIPQD